jgi:cell division initiation protein
MSLTPEDIQAKRFHDGFRGYNHEEVDVFLDEVAAAFEALLKEVAAGRARAEELEAQLFELKGTEGMLKRTLLAAQRAADEAIAEAKGEAGRLVSVAEAEAAAAVAAARQQAEDIVAAANARQAEIEELDCRLRAFQAAHRATLRAHLEDQLRALDDLPAVPGPASEAVSSLPPPSGVGEPVTHTGETV